VRTDIVTFDCYGTLVDWRRGIGDAFVEAAAGDGVTISAEDALQTFMRVEPIVEAGPYRPYRDVLRETAARVAERLGWKLDETRAGFLPDSLARWPVFEETPAALGRLRAAGHHLGILSNVDGDLLAATLPQLGAEFDLVVTAEQVREYKPHHAHFVEARRRIGDGTWLHAAQSYFHDVVPARELGISVAWINRLGEEPHGPQRPDHEFGTLGELADRLA